MQTGARRGGEAKAGLDHLLHLLLRCRPVPGDGVLDLVRRVLHDLAPRRRRLGQRQPAGLPDAHRRAHVDLEEDLLDGDAVGVVLGDQRGQLALQRGQALRQRIRRRCPDDPERQRPQHRALGAHDGVAATGEARIDAEHRAVGEHAYAR